MAAFFATCGRARLEALDAEMRTVARALRRFVKADDELVWADTVLAPGLAELGVTGNDQRPRPMHDPRNAMAVRQDPFRDAQAARLRAAGLTFDEVGRRLGVSRSTAHRMTTRALREYVARPHDEARQLAEVELDQLARQAWQVLTGEHFAISSGRVVTLGGVPIEDIRPKLDALRTLLGIAERSRGSSPPTLAAPAQSGQGLPMHDGSRGSGASLCAGCRMSVGKSVRLFLADCSPGGLLTAEIMNWTGHVMAAPRSDMPALLKRPEIGRTGVYVLIGDDPGSVTGSLAYVGEGDVVGKRLQMHARPEEQGGKDFWSRAVVLTSKDMNLTKAHARYLESRLISIAEQAKRVKLTNSTAPPVLALPEADVSDMEYFIEQAKIVLPVLGVNILRSAATASQPSTSVDPLVTSTTESPLFELRQKKDGVVARAREVDGEFTVLKGSLARATWNGVESGYKALRLQLEEDGVIPMSPSGLRVFSADHVFDSPSAAAAVVLGRSANGRHEWKVAGSGTTYGSWQSSGVEQTAFDLST